MSPTVRTEFKLACPRCGSDTSLQVTIEAWADLTVDGPEPSDHYDWNDYSACRCTSCGHEGAVEGFRVAPESLPPALKTYRFSFSETYLYETTVEAADAKHAERLIDDKLQAEGPDGFEVVKAVRDEICFEEVLP